MDSISDSALFSAHCFHGADIAELVRVRWCLHVHRTQWEAVAAADSALWMYRGISAALEIGFLHGTYVPGALTKIGRVNSTYLAWTLNDCIDSKAPLTRVGMLITVLELLNSTEGGCSEILKQTRVHLAWSKVWVNQSSFFFIRSVNIKKVSI